MCGGILKANIMVKYDAITDLLYIKKLSLTASRW